MKKIPQIGDTAWFVEWCYELGFHDEEEELVDRDACKTRTRRVSTRDEALALAKKVWVEDDVVHKLGVVTFWPATFTAYDEDDAPLHSWVGRWCEDAEDEYYEGEEDE